MNLRTIVQGRNQCILYTSFFETIERLPRYFFSSDVLIHYVFYDLETEIKLSIRYCELERIIGLILVYLQNIIIMNREYVDKT